MSCYERIEGTITLPAAEVAEVKRRVRWAHNRFVERVYDAAKDWWRANKTQSVKRYNSNIDAAVRGTYDPGASRMSDQVVFAKALRSVLSGIAWRADRDGTNLRGVTWADMEAEGMGRATNRTNEFGQAEGYISFDGPELTVGVYENNRAVEAWEQQPSVIALLYALSNVEWTLQSGGVIMYSNELQRDAMQAPSEYLVYGPGTRRGRRLRDSRWV